MDSTMSSRVVVGVDGTEGSSGALEYAVKQAGMRDASLCLINVGPSQTTFTPLLPYVQPETDTAGLATLAQARKQVAQLAPDLDVVTVLRTGSRITQLVNVAAHGQLLVLGRETRTGLSRLVSGATTASVVARSGVPTAVIPNTYPSPTVDGPVVVGLRDAQWSDDLLGVAFATASAQATSLQVVHAWDIPDPYIRRIEERASGEEWTAAGTRFVEEQVAPWRQRYPDVPITAEVVCDGPCGALLTAAQAASLVVLLRQPVPRILGAHLGRTTRSVIAATPCPALVVPSTGQEKPVFDLELEKSGELLR